MGLIQSANIGNIHANREKQLRDLIIERYQNVGEVTDATGKVLEEGVNWLEGLDDSILRDNIALLFENQAHEVSKKQALNEATDSSSSGSFEVVAFPMIRRIFSRLLANDIVSVQAMTQPEGSIFFFYPQISDRVVGTDAEGRETASHTSQHGKNLNECVLAGANCADTTYDNCRSLYDRYYDEDLYDHSKGSFTIIAATGEAVALDADGCWTSATTLKMSQDGSVREVIFAVSGFDGMNSGTSSGHTARLRGASGLEIDSEAFLTSLVCINAGDPIVDPYGNVIYNTGDEIECQPLAQKYGYSLVEYKDLCNADGVLNLKLDLTHPIAACDVCPTFDNYIGASSGTTLAPTDIVFAWRKYDDLEYETEMGEVTFTIKKEFIVSTTRRLRARWSPELAQDVQAYHNIDAEAELTALLSEQIAMEIDREILRDLKRGAAWSTRWDYNGWRNQGSQKYTIKEWNQTLVTKVNQLSAQIHKSTLRGGANFIVVSTEVSAIFDDLENFMINNKDVEDDTYNLGMKRIGTLSGRYKVYVDPYCRAGDLLVGHKGTSILDTGYIYSPYIPLQLTQTLTDVNTFANVKGIMTRYGKKMVNNRYFGIVKLDNVPQFDPRELR